MTRVLNVGGNNKDIALRAQYTRFEHVLLGIDPSGAPDIVCDARQLSSPAPAQFDAVHFSRNLEHYHRHDVPRVLSGFQHVPRNGGLAQIRVPDIEAVMKSVVARGLDGCRGHAVSVGGRADQRARCGLRLRRGNRAQRQ